MLYRWHDSIISAFYRRIVGVNGAFRFLAFFFFWRLSILDLVILLFHSTGAASEHSLVHEIRSRPGYIHVSPKISCE